MADDRPGARLGAIRVRQTALAEGESDASWGRSAASRGGAREERRQLLEEAGQNAAAARP